MKAYLRTSFAGDAARRGAHLTFEAGGYLPPSCGLRTEERPAMQTPVLAPARTARDRQGPASPRCCTASPVRHSRHHARGVMPAWLTRGQYRGQPARDVEGRCQVTVITEAGWPSIKKG